MPWRTYDPSADRSASQFVLARRLSQRRTTKRAEPRQGDALTVALGPLRRQVLYYAARLKVFCRGRSDYFRGGRLLCLRERCTNGVFLVE